MQIYDEIRTFFNCLLDQFFNGGCWKLFYGWSKSTKNWQKILISPLSKLLFGFQVLNLDTGSHESLPFTKQTLHIMSQLQVCPALKALFLYDLGLISKIMCKLHDFRRIVNNWVKSSLNIFMCKYFRPSFVLLFLALYGILLQNKLFCFLLIVISFVQTSSNNFLTKI